MIDARLRRRSTEANFVAHLEERVRGGQELQAQRGRLVRRPLERASTSRPIPRPRGATSTPAIEPQAVRQPRPHADHGPRRPDDPQDAGPRARRQARDVRQRRRLRLGDRRGARLRQLCHGRLRRAPVGPGFGPRHLQPAPRGLGRPDRRAQVRAAVPRCRTASSRCYDSPLSEYGVLGFEYGYAMRRSQDAGAVGSAVRRLRQRRADHHRPVHRRGRSQVAARQRPRAAAAARLRRPGPGALARPGSSASCSSARRTTSRSATSPRRRTTSTSCAGRCTARSASRWSS